MCTYSAHIYSRARRSDLAVFLLLRWHMSCSAFISRRRQVGTQHKDVRQRRGYAPGSTDEHVLRLRVCSEGHRESASFPQCEFYAFLFVNSRHMLCWKGVQYSLYPRVCVCVLRIRNVMCCACFFIIIVVCSTTFIDAAVTYLSRRSLLLRATRGSHVPRVAHTRP